MKDKIKEFKSALSVIPSEFTWKLQLETLKLPASHFKNNDEIKEIIYKI